ncbi:MAG: DUF192 domain-containing protein [Pseudomonadota bacterium]|nr:DUF192 domain-containing protein [Pseudomonadota bacterium]
MTIINDKDEKIIFRVEVVESEELQKKGLMYRDKLAPQTGMLFLFRNEKRTSFWMKNTNIPLDIIFIKQSGIIDSVKKNTIPLSLEKIKSESKVIAALEIPAGETALFNISKNSFVDLSGLED